MNGAGRIVGDIGAAAGVNKGAHDIRRGFGQRLADLGVPPRDLQLMMRHRDFKTTEAYYLKSDAATTSKRLAEILECTHFSKGTADRENAVFSPK